MKEKQVTEELGGILSYMTDVLFNEFNTNALTPEYLLTAILDNKKCRAYLILDTFLMSNNIEDLKKIYINFLEKNASKQFFKIGRKNDPQFNQELSKIFDDAEIEQNNLNSPLLGSEHILLSMLNPNNNNDNIIDVFKNIGIDYNLVLGRCSDSKNQIKKIQKSQKMNNVFPLKSDVNTKAISSKQNYISQYTTNINELVKSSKIDNLVGRKKEVEQIIKVLARRKKNNAILVGNGGCGKTQIVYGIAQMIESGNVPDILKNKEIIMLNVMAIISGTHFRGMFEERVNGLFTELKNTTKYILFIDDMHNVLKGSSKERDTDISSMIGSVLSEGDIRIIGTTNFKEYRNSVESNTSISRKLQKIIIEPTTIDETLEILEANKNYYEEYHNVTYSSESIKKAIELADRYITDRSLPDSAIDVIDLAGAQTCLVERFPKEYYSLKKSLNNVENEREKFLLNGDFELVESLEKEVNRIKKEISDFNREYETNKNKYKIEITNDNIAQAISEMSGVPVQKLSTNEKSKLADIETVLKKYIVGQDEAIDSICKIVKRNKVGLGNKNKTNGNVLLLGQSGVGKTLIAKKLAEEIYGSERELIRIDMSEYSEKHSVAKLTGAAPGYVGYENGGQLTEAIKNKQHCVLLLDEIEKADKEVYNLFLQLFDEGRLTDSSGQVVNFKNVIVLMTSNIGAKQAAEHGSGLGFVSNETTAKKSIIEKQLKRTFTPEFINRIDQIVYFNNLTDDNLKNIVVLEIEKFIKRLNNIGFNLNYDESVVEFIFNLAQKDKEYGARPIIRLIQNHIEDAITDLMLRNEYENNYIFNVTVEDGKLKFE